MLHRTATHDDFHCTILFSTFPHFLVYKNDSDEMPSQLT